MTIEPSTLIKQTQIIDSTQHAEITPSLKMTIEPSTLIPNSSIKAPSATTHYTVVVRNTETTILQNSILNTIIPKQTQIIDSTQHAEMTPSLKMTKTVEATLSQSITQSIAVQQFSSDTIMTTKSLDVLPVTSSLTSCNRTVKNIQLYLGFHGNLNEVSLCFSLNNFYGMTKLS